MRLLTGVLRALIACGLCAPANAGVTLSFASDTNPDGPTFHGQNLPGGPVNGLEDGAAFDANNAVIVSLTVDVNGDEPGGGTSFNSRFNFLGATTGYSVTPFAGGFLHNWSMAGSFDFVETGSGLEVIRINFGNAVFTSFSFSQFALGSTAALQSNNDTDAGLTFIVGLPLAGLGVTAADFAGQRGFSFGLARMRAVSGSQPLTLGGSGSWAQPWISEASFAAGGSPIPTPGTLALLGLAGLVMGGWRHARH